MVAMVAAAADAAESALVVACASDADDRTFVFPGERVLISFSFPYEGEDLDHGYALTLTPTTTTKEEGDEGAGIESGVDTLEASSVARAAAAGEEATTSSSAGSRGRVSGIARGVRESRREGDRVLVTIEASVPTRFGSLSRCPATLDLKQYLRHPLGVGAVGAGAHREELHEDFLCRRWTKAVDVLSPLRVSSFVRDGLVSVAVANVLPPRVATSLSLQSFQVLSDPPDRVWVSEVFPRREGGSYGEILPGRERSFVLRLDTDPRDGRGGAEADDTIAADVLLSFSSAVSHSSLLYVHHLERIARPPAPPVRVDFTHLGTRTDAGSGMGLSQVRCLVTNESAGAKTLDLVFDALDVLGGASEGGERGKGEGEGGGNCLVMDTVIPLGSVGAGASKAVTCSLMPLDSQIVSIDRVLVRDTKANVVFANAEPVKIDCGAAP